jgi:hypothetical protein
VKRELAAEIHRLGGDVGDPVWQWLIRNGPHGPRFTWNQTRKAPPGHVGVEHLQSIVAGKEEIESDFRVRAKTVIRKALLSDDVNLLRRAIQVAAVVGDEAELREISALTKHESEQVVADAQASAFYLRKRLGAKSE